MSFNWNYASHGINERGEFEGSGRCYRSSLPITGKVMFIHGSPGECKLLNGENDEFTNTTRVWFQPGKCNTTRKNVTLAFSIEELKELVEPQVTPRLKWDIFNNYSRISLFWPPRK